MFPSLILHTCSPQEASDSGDIGKHFPALLRLSGATCLGLLLECGQGCGGPCTGLSTEEPSDFHAVFSQFVKLESKDITCGQLLRGGKLAT